MDFLHLFFSQYASLWDAMFSKGFVPLVRYMPFWGPIVLGGALYAMYTRYTRTSYFASLTYVLLEVRVPREQARSPLAMEVVLNALHITSGEGTWYKRLIRGGRRAVHSLEIVSIEGQVHFMIRIRENLREVLESHIYSQYPQAEVSIVDDYTASIPYNAYKGEWELFGLEFKLNKPDSYPIKTYVDFGLDKPGQEEFEKIDPLTPIIEFMGSLRGYEQMWFQIITRATKGKPNPGFFSRLPDRVINPRGHETDWKKDAQKEVEKIREKYGASKDDPYALPSQFRLTKGEQEVIWALEREIMKLGFDCGIRVLYLARKDAYRDSLVNGLYGILRPFNSNVLNSFTLADAGETTFNYPWEDFNDIRLRYRKQKMFDAYRFRGWFFRPYLKNWCILNSEELATMYHFPGQVSETPTFTRIMSKKAEPPANLPR